jgi:lipoprotein-anchoring transpeptidase ErfK/SrfK
MRALTITLAACSLALAALAAPSASGQAAPQPFDVAAPSRAAGATVARIVTPTVARRRLGSARNARRVPIQTDWSAQQQTLLVLDGAVHAGREWVKVLLPERPNGSAGWVPRDHVALGSTPFWIDVRTRARRVTVYRAGKRVRQTRAVVGTSRTPTPLGLAAVYEINRQPKPRGFLGPWVLALTSHSDVLKRFGGGPGRVGLHGRAGASLRDPLGSARSHGCIRVPNGHITWMARRIPLGTPMLVRR